MTCFTQHSFFLQIHSTLRKQPNTNPHYLFRIANGLNNSQVFHKGRDPYLIEIRKIGCNTNEPQVEWNQTHFQNKEPRTISQTSSNFSLVFVFPSFSGASERGGKRDSFCNLGMCVWLPIITPSRYRTSIPPVFLGRTSNPPDSCGKLYAEWGAHIMRLYMVVRATSPLGYGHSTQKAPVLVRSP